MAADVLAFLDARRIDGATILGLSMGGLVALELALVHPERVKGLVVVDVAPRVERAGTEEIRAHLSVLEFDTFEEAVARARAFNPRRTLENLRERLRHGLRRRPDGKWVYKFDPAILAFEAAESLETLWGRLGAVRCPTLLVRGAESPLLARETAERFARELPAAELAEVPGAGHSVMGDNPQGFLAVVKPFLERHGL
jgi:pimeloyl-ACP methyl ester carboxylesterase